MDPVEIAYQYEPIGMISFKSKSILQIGPDPHTIVSTQNQTDGSIIADSADVEADPRVRERARVEACRFGADALMVGMHVMTGTHHGAQTQTSSVLLLHERETPLASGAIGQPGSPAVPTVVR
jgi:hypothetical protein